MAETEYGVLSPPTPEQRRIAAGQFERANQVIAKGDHDYGIRLLLSCCQLDPGNLSFRQTLRRTEKTKYRNNMRGGWLAWLFTWPARARIRSARRACDWLKVLGQGERVLVRNPWEITTQLEMANAAENLGLLDMGIWIVDQARQKNPRDARVNRKLAQLFEKRGNFTQAMALWNLVLQVNPRDDEAEQKTKDLAISETILKGNYEGAISGGTLVRPGAPPIAGSTGAPAGAGAAAASEAATTNSTAPVDRVAREALSIRAKIDADPTNPNGYLQLAALYRRADRIDESREAVEQGLGPTGNHFDLAMEVLDLRIEPLRRDLKVAEQLLRETPDSKDLRKLQAQLSREIDARELEMFRQRADRFPANMAFRFELGVRLYRTGQLDEAIRELQTTRADPRHQWRSLMHLGLCFRSRNNWRLARRNFEDALQNLPQGNQDQRKEILFNLAQGCADAGDFAEAVEFGAELANMDFAYRDIGRLLDEWQSRLQEAS
jgi:tetratricopeptide (TPR) repeat protein